MKQQFKKNRWLFAYFICLCLYLGGCQEGVQESGAPQVKESGISSESYGETSSSIRITETIATVSEAFTEEKNEGQNADEVESESRPAEKNEPYTLDITPGEKASGSPPREGAGRMIAEEIRDEPFLTAPGLGEIRPELFYQDGIITKRSRFLSFIFPDPLKADPPPQSGSTDIAPMSLALYTDHPDSRILSCSLAEGSAAYDYLVEQFVRTEYVSSWQSYEQGIRPLFILQLMDEKETPHTFLIDENGYILHFPGLCDYEQALPNYAMVTARSAAKIDSLSLMKCLAIAAYALDTEAAGTRDFFRLNHSRFTEGSLGPSLGWESILNNAFEKAELKIEGRGRAVTVDSAELFKKVIRFFCGELFGEDYACDCFWRGETAADASEENLRLTLRLKQTQNEEEKIWAEAFLTPEGELLVRKDSFAYMLSAEQGVYQISFQGRFVSSPDEKYSPEALLDILGW